MTTVAVIPARAGSKSLPGKNLMAVGGVSLVARAIQVARRAAGLDEVLVSSDGPEILEEARSHGAEAVVRPTRLATETATTVDVLLDLLADRPHIDRLVVLQPTSPLREPIDVERCLALLDGAPAAVTVNAAAHPPAWTFLMGAGQVLRPLWGWEALPNRRQDTEPYFTVNGAVYAVHAAHLKAGHALLGPETVAVEMPRERSVDVDDVIDLVVAEAMERHLRSSGGR